MTFRKRVYTERGFRLHIIILDAISSAKRGLFKFFFIKERLEQHVIKVYKLPRGEKLRTYSFNFPNLLNSKNGSLPETESRISKKGEF